MYGVPSIFGESFLDSAFADFDQLMRNHNFSYDDTFPPINLYMSKSGESCNFELALTGYKKDWLSVSIEGKNLVIEATVPEEKDGDEKKYVKRRIKASSFKKTYRIPEGYDVEKTEVSYEDGLLSIYIPKKVVKPVESSAKKLLIK